MAGSERRVFPRAEGEYPAWYQVGSRGFCRCIALDIGVDGARLVVPEELPEGQSFEVSFQLASDWLVRASAQKIWQSFDLEGFQVGVRYRPLRSADRSLIGPWVYQQRKRSR